MECWPPRAPATPAEGLSIPGRYTAPASRADSHTRRERQEPRPQTDSPPPFGAAVPEAWQRAMPGHSRQGRQNETRLHRAPASSSPTECLPVLRPPSVSFSPLELHGHHLLVGADCLIADL